ncbi:hypothetical protein HDU91_000549 [Kappamyces sp. JEL0680]|nr:hypothetical protein HDU91_000549 [Kappamyces sp. JEL0680]
MVLLVGLLLALSFIQYYASVAMTGLLCCICSILLFGSPLFDLGKVWRFGSPAGLIHLPLTLLALATSFLWSLIGWRMGPDYWVFVPNCIGCILSIVQLAVYRYFTAGQRKRPQSRSLDVGFLPLSNQ